MSELLDLLCRVHFVKENLTPSEEFPVQGWSWFSEQNVIQKILDEFDKLLKSGKFIDCRSPFWHPGKCEIWLSVGDSTEGQDVEHAMEVLGNIRGVKKVNLQYEGGPPKDKGWLQLSGEGEPVNFARGDRYVKPGTPGAVQGPQGGWFIPAGGSEKSDPKAQPKGGSFHDVSLEKPLVLPHYQAATFDVADRSAQQWVDRLPGGSQRENLFAQAVGIPVGQTNCGILLQAQYRLNPGALYFEAIGKGIKSSGSISADGQTLSLDNFSISQNIPSQGSSGSLPNPLKGQMVRIMVDMVKALRAIGIKKIMMHAAGDPHDTPSIFNGYYTWPRLGVGGKIPSYAMDRLPGDIRTRMHSSTEVLDLFKIPGGALAWKENGTGIFPATFDVAPSSKNCQALASYLEQKQRGLASFNDDPLVDMEPVYQRTNWTCGRNCLVALAKHYHVDPKPIQDLGDKEDGTSPQEMLTGLEELGLGSKAIQGLSNKELRQYLDKEIPVILCLQAHGSKTLKRKGDSGHWAVAIGYDENHYVFMDPSQKTGHGFLPRKELGQRWFDYDGHGKLYRRYGIVVQAPGSSVANFAYKDEPLPDGGQWKTIMGEHLYIKDDVIHSGEHAGKRVDDFIDQRKSKPAKEEVNAVKDEGSLHKMARAAATALEDSFNSAVKALDRGTEHVPVVKQIKGVLGWVKDKAKSLYKGLEKRYGTKTAIGCMAFGQVLDLGTVGAGMALGIPLYIPGLSILGTLPAVAMAEIYHQLRGKVHFGQELLDLDDARKMARTLVVKLRQEFLKYLKDNKAEIASVFHKANKSRRAKFAWLLDLAKFAHGDWEPYIGKRRQRKGQPGLKNPRTGQVIWDGEQGFEDILKEKLQAGGWKEGSWLPAEPVPETRIPENPPSGIPNLPGLPGLPTDEELARAQQAGLLSHLATASHRVDVVTIGNRQFVLKPVDDSGIDDPQSRANEVLVSSVAKDMGADVPASRLAVLPGHFPGGGAGQVLVSEFVAGKVLFSCLHKLTDPTGQDYHSHDDNKNALFLALQCMPGNLEKMAVMGYLVNIGDRHGGNFLITDPPNRRLVSIDHEYAFKNIEVQPPHIPVLEEAMAAANKPIPVEVVQSGIAAMEKHLPILRDLETQGVLKAGTTAEAEQRLNQLRPFSISGTGLTFAELRRLPKR